MLNANSEGIALSSVTVLIIVYTVNSKIVFISSSCFLFFFCPNHPYKSQFRAEILWNFIHASETSGEGSLWVKKIVGCHL